MHAGERIQKCWHNQTACAVFFLPRQEMRSTCKSVSLPATSPNWWDETKATERWQEETKTDIECQNQGSRNVTWQMMDWNENRVIAVLTENPEEKIEDNYGKRKANTLIWKEHRIKEVQMLQRKSKARSCYNCIRFFPSLIVSAFLSALPLSLFVFVHFSLLLSMFFVFPPFYYLFIFPLSCIFSTSCSPLYNHALFFSLILFPPSFSFSQLSPLTQTFSLSLSLHNSVTELLCVPLQPCLC